MQPPNLSRVAQPIRLRTTSEQANKRPHFMWALVVCMSCLWTACSSELERNTPVAPPVASLSGLLAQSTATRATNSSSARTSEASYGNPDPDLGAKQPTRRSHLTDDSTAGQKSAAADNPEADQGTSAFHVVDLARGLAQLSVQIDVASEHRFDSAQGVHVAWRLPYPAANTLEASRSNPHLEMTTSGPAANTIRLPVEVLQGVTSSLMALETLPPPREQPILWIEGRWLHAYSRQQGASNASLKLTYPVRAARLAGRYQAPQKARPLNKLLLGRDVIEDGLNSSYSSMWLEAGTQVELNPSSFEGGTLRGRLFPSQENIDASVELQLEVEQLDSGQVERQTVRATGAPIELVLPQHDPGQRVTLRATGPDGSLVRLEQARIDSAIPIERPNVLLIIVDTLRADRLNSFGGTLDLTPNLDALASESMIFSDYWATSSWTLPTISTMLTSVHMEVHGGKDKQSPINPNITTLATALNDAGYRTEAITEGGLFRSVYNLDRGYEHFVEHQNGLGEGIQLTNAFLDSRADNEPWFLTLHSYEVHEPYTPDQALLDQVRASLPPEMAQGIERPTDFIEFFESGEWDQVLSANVPALMEELHNAEVEHADRLIGMLLNRLRAEGRLDNTLVVVTADHGEEFGEHGMLGHSDSLYPELLRIPLLVRFPDGYGAGQVVEAPTSQLSLTPTILDAVGLSESAQSDAFQGTSLLRAGARAPVFASRYLDNGDSLYALRDGDTLLIQGTYKFERLSRGTPDIELYALDQDPGAQVDLDVSDPRQLEAMRTLMQSLRAQYSANAYSGRDLQIDAATQKNLAELGYL